MQGLNILGKNPLQNAFPYAIILLVKHTWGYSSAGRALEWHSRGQRFDPAYLHQKKRGFTVFENGEASFAIWERIGWFYVRHFVKADIWSAKPVSYTHLDVYKRQIRSS